MSIKLYNCDCEFDVLANQAGETGVVGYKLTSECSVCEQARIAATAAALVERTENRIREIKNRIIQLTNEKAQATSLGYTDLVSDKQTEIDNLETELTALVGIKNDRQID
jgi:hypothetical protein